ncbi:MAG: alpha/beta hydrolase [Steroidobacteraceae bacterium]
MIRWRVMRAVLQKDLRCVWPAVLLTVAIFGGDVLLTRLDVWPVWEVVRQPLVLLSAALLVFAVFQLDSPVSLVDDWLCRPIPRRDLLIAKTGLILATIYGSRVLATLALDVAQTRSAGETLADAVLIQDDFFVLVLAMLVLIGVVTSTTIQAIGALIAMFIVLLVLPTAFMPSVGPLRPVIGEALMSNGMTWLVSAPAKFFAVTGILVCFVLVYALRRTSLARAWVVTCVVIGLAIFLVPMFHLPWSALAAIQAGVIPQTPAPERLSIITRRACFPSTHLSAVGEGPFGALQQGSRLRWWTDAELGDAGPDSIAFVTSMQPRGLPQDWRAQLAYATAEYRDSQKAAVELRPTHYMTAGPGAFTHSWLLPESAATRLENPTASFRYSFALLQPYEHSLPLDGKRHRLEELGYCGARRIASNNTIEVDCLVTGSRVAQVSAELPAIGPSAVYGPLDYSPAWMRGLLAQRVKLTVSSARLSTESSVTVTAWRNAGLVARSWSANGLLGGDAESCPLPGSGGNERLQSSRWRDATAHETQLISVDAGVSLEVLDYGGTGSPILLVPGLGATAHSFDTLAPRLARNHRVFAMTRRGAGASSRVDFGYDTPRLARDILAVLDALELKTVTLVGHSIAGDELTWLGGHHADRLSGVVYLDAAYDRSVRAVNPEMQALQSLLPPEPPLIERDMNDYAAFRALQARRLGPAIPEGEMIAFNQAGKPFLAGTPDIDPRVAAAIPAALKRPDYRALKIPVLALYATRDESAPIKPWFDRNDAEQMRALRDIGVMTERARRASIEQLRTEAPSAEIIELNGADHWIFLSHEQDVVDALERFTARVGR